MSSYTYDMNSFAADLPQLIPSDIYTYAAAAACRSSAGQSTTFSAEIVDPSVGAAQETWSFSHASCCGVAEIASFTNATMEHRISEFGAIAIVVVVLFKRESIRVREVMKVGRGSDYVLEDFNGNDAGTVEVSGTKSQYCSGVSSKKRRQAGRTKSSVRRIGIVAFGGPELLIERIP